VVDKVFGNIDFDKLGWHRDDKEKKEIYFSNYRVLNWLSAQLDMLHNIKKCLIFGTS